MSTPFYTLEEIAILGDTSVFRLERSDAHADPEALYVPTNQMLEAIVELMVVYEIVIPTDPSPFDAIPENNQGIKDIFPTVEYNHGNGGFTVSTINGDTGENVFGAGSSIAKAIADLARNNGYETSIHKGGHVGLAAWIAEINYGVERASKERLDIELQAIVNPDAGAW